jgi:carbon-monoxide dehydrogenase medium subunit
MIPNKFEYFAPKSIDEALGLLAQHGDEAKLLSGGHSLIPVLKLRLSAPGVIVDIGRITEMKGIRRDGDRLLIGALSTHHEIATSNLASEVCPLLCRAASRIGDQQVRNRGTIGGSLTHADPAADWPAPVLALDAEMVVRGNGGERVIKATEFFVGMLTTAVRSDEILTQIRVPLPAQPLRSSYEKVAQSASGFAVIGVAVQLEVSDSSIAGAAIGVTGLAPQAFRATSAEAELKGRPADPATLQAASEMADAEATETMDDIHASGEYRRHLTRVYTRRALEAALSKA